MTATAPSGGNYDLLAAAIRQRRLVEGTYEGFHRILQPHLIGHSNGEPMLHAYQVGGESHEPLEPPGSPKNWRCFRIDELSGITVRGGLWIPFPKGHGGHERCIRNIDWTDALEAEE